jgi:hypothetical protein
MKPYLFTALMLTAATAVVAATTSMPSQPAVAQAAQTSFFCGQAEGNPATIARTPRGEVVMIRYTKDMGNFDPRTRCQQVSTRFQSAYTNKTLRFITSGTLNGQRIICVAQNRTSGCKSTGLLFTLRPQDNERQVLASLINQSRYATAPAVIQNCVPKREVDLSQPVTIDINEFLYQCPPEPVEPSQPQ